MLDTDTKRRIDSCRDILVGKVPDPKSQVEQITIALIYKFMDDMDAQSEEFGGKRSFFVNGFEKYSWSKLLAPSMGGQDTLNLYSEAIGKMTENTHLPVLFRDIFKNAYLPYRDPETLKSFLKEIDWFDYEHSEKLGDAFEYLLSVLGSQGDAGQFRTPRHIIDFTVRVINPQKHERILDPACGTAGFLISAWKYIQECNKKTRPGDLLTPAERNKLAANIHGYDISPDMVRLSLVNLYLHGFTHPHVEEYDTLTSEDKWNDHFDVILANPPFMSPKGGIKPHKRFSIQAKRSEVLFVDYIHEHLSPNGRAGIIVPEGIIFQSGTAYKALRKLLVQNSLVAVISLPAGVFQPYSGVKTSILILDKRLAKQTDKLLFVKVNSDGFALGAQRRQVEHDDLPQAEQALAAFFAAPADFEGSELAQAVKRERLAENGEWSLSGERYLTRELQHTQYDVVSVADICQINPKKSELNDIQPSTLVSFVPMQDLGEHTISFKPQQIKQLSEVREGAYTYFRNDDVLIAKVTPCFENGKAGVAHGLENGIGFGSSEFYVLRASERVSPEFLYYMLTSDRFRAEATAQMTGTGGLQRVPRSVIESFKIPLPPIQTQHDITAEIKSCQKIITGARQVVESYQPHISIDAAWPIVPLSEIIKLSSGEFLSAAMKKDGSHAVYGGNGINGTHNEYLFEAPTVVIGRVGAYCGAVHLTEPKSWVTDNGLYVKELLKPVELKFLAVSLSNLNLNQYAKVGGQPSISQSIVLERGIALPDIVTQQKIVSELEAEQELVNANKELISRFEAKIKIVIDRVWAS